MSENLNQAGVHARGAGVDADGEATGAWLAAFPDPPAAFRLVPFWSWNERMEPEEVRRQVRIIKQGGWGGAFVHSRIGLTTPYLGEEWFQAVDATLAACREEGLLVWLYDEDKWPSGYSGGTVPLADERFRAKALVARPAGSPAPADCEPVGDLVDGLQVYRWVAPLGDPWFNGTCAVDRGSRDAMGRFVDDAYASYYERYGEDYGGLIQAEFTDEPCMMFRIRCPEGSVPHSETAFERFLELHGYDPVPHLTKLFTDGEDSESFRLHWHRTINDLFENNFSRQLGDWCADHGIDLTGHYMCEHGLFAQQNWGVKIMPNYRHQQIPGIDHLGRQINERITAKQCQSMVNQFGKKRMLSELYGVAGGGLSFEDRKWIALQQICLGVNLLNPHLSLYTMSGCRKRDFPQNIFYQQPWWELNHLLDDALARLCLVMSQGHCRASILLLHPQESVQALWQTRTEGFDQNPNKVYEGQDWSSVTAEGAGRIFELEHQFIETINTLLGAQRSFDLGDEWVLRDHGRVIRGDRGIELQVEKMHYGLVVIPSMETLAPATFELLQAFQSAGGALLVHGNPPRKLDGVPSDALAAWVDALPNASVVDFHQKLEEISPRTILFDPVYSGDPSMLWAHPRDLDDGSRIVLLVNLSRIETFAGDLRVHGGWNHAYRLDEFSGEVTALPVDRLPDHTLRYPLEMAPAECRLMLLTHDEQALTGLERKPDHVEGPVVDTPLHVESVERLDDNAFTLDYARWKEAGGDWSKEPVPVVELQYSLNAGKYDGPLSLSYPFVMEGLAPDRNVHLVVEHPELCRILLNGNEVKYEGLPWWRDIRWLPIDITGKLVAGENTVTLEYADFEHGDPTIVEPAEARYGTEIESIYLVGDFAVVGETTGTAPLQHRFQEWQVPPVEVDTLVHSGTALTDPRPLIFGGVSRQGLPFYAGRLALHVSLPALSKDVGPVYLVVEKLLAAVAEVSVDGETCGHFLAHPYRVDLTAAVTDGRPHALTIVLYSTLRNLLGPHHHIEGELIEVGPDHFTSVELAGHPDRHGALRQWGEGNWQPSDWREDYCLLKFGDLGSIHLVHPA